MTLNTFIAENPSVLNRRGVGKVVWRSVINDLIESERQDLRELREMRDRTRDLDMMRLLCTLLERKTERVIELNELLRYRDKDSEAQR